jgi:hypothetical protein
LKIILIGPSAPFRGGIANFNDSLYTALDKNMTSVIFRIFTAIPFPFFSRPFSIRKRGPSSQHPIKTTYKFHKSLKLVLGCRRDSAKANPTA